MGPNNMAGADVYTGVTAEAIAMAVAGRGAEAAETGEGRVAALFEAHHLRLYKLARRMCDSRESARDLVQETFLRAARAVASIPDGDAAEEAWLVRVLINICRDDWRRQLRRSRLGTLAAPIAAAVSDPEAALIARTLVWKALRLLSPRRRAALVMYELEGTSIPEIARLLGVSPVTVRWHLSRGRRELAKLIGRNSSKAEKPS